MKRPVEPIDLSRVRTYSIAERESKVSVEDFASVWRRGGTFSEFLSGLPAILAGGELREVIEAVARAVAANRPVVLAMGAHVIKVGLGPVLADLMDRGILSGVAMNGAGIVHDLEVALVGRTSEDVSAGLGSGEFGMARETCNFLGEAIRNAGTAGVGLGRAVGDLILRSEMPFRSHSILAAGARLGIPVTVHVAIGTDILHMHPGFDPAAAGEASHRDFRTFASLVGELEGGVYLNVGSAVILPEVFLKAVTLVRNLGRRLDRFTAVNLDFVRHYRPTTNVVGRPVAGGGRGIQLVGHHEILVPLIAAGVIERLGA